jgi:hypothetical protein
MFVLRTTSMIGIHVLVFELIDWWETVVQLAIIEVLGKFVAEILGSRGYFLVPARPWESTQASSERVPTFFVP